MSLVIQLDNVGWDVNEAFGQGADGASVPIKVLVFVDRQSGIVVTVPFTEDKADELAAKLRGMSIVSAKGALH